ncbi:AP-1-like transcription factor YAP1 [Podospora conica]|nr:AP-1-like transcription factor YAP1 [Schizothecium conicum]
MDEYNSFDVPSPSNSLYYNMYADADQYLESHTSESQSPSGSLYDVPSGEYNGIAHVYPSPERDEDDSQPSQGQTKPAAKRKRENRYKNAPPSVLSRRRAQNRASQRAYRERKDQRIKDLEQMLTDAKQRNDVLGQAYAELHSEYILLKTSQLKEQSSYPTEQQLAYPSMGMPTAGDGLDMDLFVYSDMQTGYTL